MNKYEVLVVDDVESAAKTYAELIITKTKFETTYTNNPDEAINIVRNNPIKVVVLDQKMPQKSGTELYREIKTIANDIVAIMVSGEADANDVGVAYKELKYGSYLHKSEISKLPQIVFEMYAFYETEVSKKNTHSVQNKKDLIKCLKCIFLRKKYYTINTFTKINNNFTFIDLWEEIESINDGQEKEITFEYKYNSKIKFAEEQSISLRTNIPLFESIINCAISSKYGKEIEEGETRTISKSTKTKFDNQLLNFDSTQIVSRDYEKNNVYNEFRVIIEERCFFCGEKKYTPIHIYKQNGKYATRTIYHLSDGTQKIINTGIHKI